MEHWKARLVRIALIAAAFLWPTLALAAGCGTAPDRSGDWQFVDDLALNMRLVAQGPNATGVYSTVDREANFSSATLRDATLSWSGYSTVSYSASMEFWAGSKDTRSRETMRVTLDVPPMQEAFLRVRPVSRVDLYEFDAGCVWFNTSTYEYRTAIADYDVSGRADRAWHESSVWIRSVY